MRAEGGTRERQHLGGAVLHEGEQAGAVARGVFEGSVAVTGENVGEGDLFFYSKQDRQGIIFAGIDIENEGVVVWFVHLALLIPNELMG